MVVFHGFVYVYQRVCLLWKSCTVGVVTYFNLVARMGERYPLQKKTNTTSCRVWSSFCVFYVSLLGRRSPRARYVPFVCCSHTPVLASLMFGYLFNYMVSGWVVTPSNRDRIRWDKDHLIYQRFEYVWIVWWGNLEENPIFACKLIQFYIFNSGFVFIYPLGIGLTKPSGT